RLKLWRSDVCSNKVHIADVSLVLLKRRDPFRVRRPKQNGTVAFGPSGVVGRVTEICYAIGRQLRLLIRRNVAHPQVPVFYERGLFSVRRDDRSTAAASASSWDSLSRDPQFREAVGLGTRCVR